MTSNHEMRNFFDRLAPNWNNHPEEYYIREKITALADFPEGNLIADIGCGQGVMLEHLLKTNPREIIAIDLSAEMLKHARKNFTDPRITFMNADFLETDLPPLDAIILYNAYPHFLNKEALARKTAEIIRKNGYLIIAHGCGKAGINSGHSGERVSPLSAALEDAEKEAAKFKDFFTPEVTVDNDELYFVKMRRI